MPRKTKVKSSDILQENVLKNNLQATREKLFDENLIVWDVKKDDVIEFFDPNLSYELTHYRPINETSGLDFRPEWFTDTREVKLQTGKYCAYPMGTKAYHDFWKREYDRCNNGYEVNGYRITGDHYFFLNYYQLPASEVPKAGQGRGLIFPVFFSKQYEYFHYIEMAQILKKDVLSVKSRSVGQTERPTLNSAKSVKTKVINHDE